jgi:hypothetical protein
MGAAQAKSIDRPLGFGYESSHAPSDVPFV